MEPLELTAGYLRREAGVFRFRAQHTPNLERAEEYWKIASWYEEASAEACTTVGFDRKCDRRWEDAMPRCGQRAYVSVAKPSTAGFDRPLLTKGIVYIEFCLLKRLD